MNNLVKPVSIWKNRTTTELQLHFLQIIVHRLSVQSMSTNMNMLETQEIKDIPNSI